MAYDLGDSITLTYLVTDSNGNPANAGAVVLTITLPDGTTATPAVTNSVTGTYTCSYPTVQIGLHGVRWLATGTNPGAEADVFEVADPAFLPLISLADAKSHLNISVSTYDEKLRSMIAVATSIAEAYTNRALSRQTMVESFHGGDTYIILTRPQVLSITSVTENGNLLTPTDYACNKLSGLLFRGTYAYTAPWAIGVDNIVVTYVSGLMAPDPSLQWGVKEILRWLWTNTQNEPRPGYSKPGDGVLTDALPKWLYRPLDPYVMPGIG